MTANASTGPEGVLSAKRGRRLWFPFGVAVLAAIGITSIRLQPEMERNFKGWATLAIMLLAVLLGLIWFLFLSRLAWRTRRRAKHTEPF